MNHLRASTISYAFLGSFLSWTFLIERFGDSVFPVVIAVTGMILTTYLLSRGGDGSMRRIVIVISAIIIGIFVSSIAMILRAHWMLDTSIETFADKGTVVISGWVADAPEHRPTTSRYVVEAESIRDTCKRGTTCQTFMSTAHGKVLVTGFAWPLGEYGDPVTVTGKLKQPGIIEGFDYGRYLSLKDIYAMMDNGWIEGSKIEPQSRPMGWQIIRGLHGVRTWFESNVQNVFTEPQASLLLGLMTGTTSSLPGYLSDAFRTAGLSHIVAVSGYNVTIVLLILSGLLCWLPIRRRIPILAMALVAYGILTGASPPVMRAVIMGILGLLAILAERQTTPRLTILWTAFFMVLWRPQSIAFDVSFQLSFLAVIGLMELSPWLSKILKRVPDTLGIRTSLAATLAAQIATIPLTVFTFRQISLVAPLTNILVAPLIPVAMLSGFVATLAGMLWMPLGLALGYPAWAVLELIILIAKIGAGVPWAAIRF